MVSGTGIIVYARFNKENKIIIAINNNDYECNISIPVWKIGLKDKDLITRLYKTQGESFGYSGKAYYVENGNLNACIYKKSGVIFSNGN